MRSITVSWQTIASAQTLCHSSIALLGHQLYNMPPTVIRDIPASVMYLKDIGQISADSTWWTTDKVIHWMRRTDSNSLIHTAHLASSQQQTWASYQIAGCAWAGNVGNVFPTTDFKGNCKLTIPVCIRACASRTCYDACRDCLPAVAGKTFPAFPAHAHPQCYISGERPMVVGKKA